MTDWETRVVAVWADTALSDADVIEQIDALAAERPVGDARALFERAGARDSAGLEEDAEPLYRQAIAAGLDHEHRAQATIQLASTLRNLGRLDESRALLEGELARADSPLPAESAAFLALTLASAGESQRAAAVALEALAPHLTRYSRSVLAYARELRATP